MADFLPAFLRDGFFGIGRGNAVSGFKPFRGNRRRSAPTLPSYGGCTSFESQGLRPSMHARFRYTGIRVRDLDRSLAFYRDVLGMKVIAKGTMPHGGRYVHLRTPRSPQRLELNWYPKTSRFHAPYRPGEELDHLAFVVDDVRTAFKELVAHGATVAVDPAHSKDTEVYVKDPDGIWIELLG